MPIGKIVQRHQGFTYIAVLILIAVLGLVAAAAGELWSTIRQREREQELLLIGEQFRGAIGQYYERTPGTVKRYPVELRSLLKDDRFMSPQHHLRKVFSDPMTRSQEWGIVRAEDGGIAGVYSLSNTRPTKIGDFDFRNEGFANAKTYTDWRFVYRPPLAGATSEAAPKQPIPR